MINENDLKQKRDFIVNNISNVPKEVLEKLNKEFEVEYTYNTIAIEGNTLSLIETKLLLEDKISVAGKELREIYEATNHEKALNYVKDCIEKREELNEDKVKDIHEILVQNIFQGGIYRNHDVRITGATHTPPSPEEMYKQLKCFYEDLKLNSNKMLPIELAAWVHAEFVRIHPFPDGNGRTARLLMNYELMSNNYLPIDIKAKNKEEYYKVLDTFVATGELTPFITLIYNQEKERLEYIEHIIKQIQSSSN